MFALDPRTALRAFWLGLAGLCLTMGVVRWWPARPSENPAYDALSKALTRRIVADSLALDSAQVALRSAQRSVNATLVVYKHQRDTLNIRDTVQVKVFVAVADSVAKSCHELDNACERFRVRADSTIADLTLDRDRWKLQAESEKPSGLKRAWDRVKVPLAFGVGLYTGSRVVR